MAAPILTSSSASPHIPVHKVKRKPAPKLLSPITPIRTPKVDSIVTPPTETVHAQKHSAVPSSGIHVRAPSVSLFTDRYPAPDPNDPFAPLSVLRDRSRRCSIIALNTFAAGSEITNSSREIDSAADVFSSHPPTKPLIPSKAARTLGADKDTHECIPEKKNARKRTSVCSFELYPDPPPLAIHGTVVENENWSVANVSHSSKTPQSNASTPTKAASPGHYTPHSRQRVQSSFPALSSPSPTGKLHLLAPAPEAYPLPSLVRDRSESDASGNSSNGTGSHGHSGSRSDSSSFTPGGTISDSPSGSFNNSQIDIFDSYAVTASLLSQSRNRAHSPSPSRNASPSHISREQGFKPVSPQQTPKARGTKEREVERSMSPASSMFRLARFFTGKSSKASEGSPPRNEKAKPVSPSSKNSPSRGRRRTRKLSTSSISISAPVTPPVSIALGQDLRYPIEGLPSLQTRPMNRQRSQTTSGLPLPSASSRLGPYASDASVNSSPVSISAAGLAAAPRLNEFGVISDQEIEYEISKDLKMSRLKPWTASIPRKRSSLSLTILPNHSESDGACGSSLKGDEVRRLDSNLTATTCETRNGKGSRESAVSAGSMGSSYVRVLRSHEETDGEEEYTRRKRALSPPSSKTAETSKSSGITGIRFPGFRRAQTGAQALSQSVTASGNVSGSVRGLKISSPMLRVPPGPQSAAAESGTALTYPSTVSLTPPVLYHATKLHERAMSDSDVSTPNLSTCTTLPIDDAKTLTNDETTVDTQLPSSSELQALLELPLLDENGQKTAFGDILRVAGVESGKTVIVLFIRHFWCPLDQDYVQQVGRLLRRLSEDGGVWQLNTKEGELRLGSGKGQKELPEVVIISNGSPALIPKYKEIIVGGERGSELKLRMYTDPSCETYSVLGMGNMGEACTNVSPTSRPSTPLPPVTKRSSTTPSPPISPDPSRGRSINPSSKYEAGVPLARTDHRTPPRKEHRKSRSLAPINTFLLPPPGSDILRSRSPSPSPASRSPVGSAGHAPLSRSVSPAPSISSTQDHSHGTYVKHTSVVSGIATVVLRAVRVGMPIWEKGGAIKQLGGELVFRVSRDHEQTSDLLQVECTYAHRMQNAQDHISFGDVLKIALTTTPSNNFVSFRASPADSSLGIPRPIESHMKYPSKDSHSYERCLSAPSYSSTDVRPASLRRAATSSPPSLANASWWADEGDTLKDYFEENLHSTLPELDSVKQESSDSWGDKLHILRAGASRKSSESIRGIRARDSIHSSTSTGSTTPSSTRAIRAVRAPRDPTKVRMHSVSAESLTASPSRKTVKNFGSGMEGIERVLEYGESISSPDLSLLAQLAVNARCPDTHCPSPNAMESTSTLNSVYYDAHEGAVEHRDDSINAGEQESRVALDAIPVDSRSGSRRTNSPEAQDRTFDSIQSEYSNVSAAGTEQLTSICSQSTSDECGDDQEKLRELLVMRAGSSMRSREH